MYKSPYRTTRSREATGGHYKMFALLVVGIVLFFGGISWFRHQANDPVGAEEEVVSDQPLSIVTGAQAPVRRSREEATVYNVDQVGLAVASRGVEDHTFHHTLVAHLSDPPEGQHYQGWLVRSEPFNFFSTGSMDKNADGTFALIWDGAFGKDFHDYDQVVITLEKDGGDTGPSIHILEGRF